MHLLEVQNTVLLLVNFMAYDDLQTELSNSISIVTY